jgi:integrase
MTTAAVAIAYRSLDAPIDVGATLEQFATYSSTLALSADAVELRVRLARRFVAAHPDLSVWSQRTVTARLADLERIKAWPFVAWMILRGDIAADVEFLLVKHAGCLHRIALDLHPGCFEPVTAAAARLGWSPRWAHTVAQQGVTVIVAANAQDPAGALTAEHLTAASTTAASTRLLSESQRDTRRKVFNGVHQALYEAGIVDEPQRRTRAGAGGRHGVLAAVNPSLRRPMLDYLDIRASVLRPMTIDGMTNDLAVFGEFITTRFPEVVSLRKLQRHHIEAFCQWVASRPYRGRRHRPDKRVGASSAAHTVLTLRTFFDDIGAWGWHERPRRQILFAADIPREPKLLPRALTPDVDAAVMAAVAGLDDPMARAGLTILRHTGLRIGELIDLEVDCVIDYGPHGSWLRVPLGKLNTERTVPLEDVTLETLDAWMNQRGRQRPLPHPRHQRPADFLFLEHGRRPNPARFRRGLAAAVQAVGLLGPDNTPMRVVPHQLRHTWATELANAGMTLQALMALLGHQSPNMTMRYATLASPTLRRAYDEAIGKLRRRIPIAPAGRPPVAPEREQWLHSEMLKTRVAHGYCSRDQAAGACPYANICEQCDNFTTNTTFAPTIDDQIQDLQTLSADASQRGWTDEAARHNRVIASLQAHTQHLHRDTTRQTTT